MLEAQVEALHVDKAAAEAALFATSSQLTESQAMVSRLRAETVELER